MGALRQKARKRKIDISNVPSGKVAGNVGMVRTQPKPTIPLNNTLKNMWENDQNNGDKSDNV